ncbi:hypothetical protein TNCV_3968711 [Trichonephila clavipes]|nr:hypothetical protein TNCV_3968711 [Trichonephila clavipes]
MTTSIKMFTKPSVQRRLPQDCLKESSRKVHAYDVDGLMHVKSVEAQSLPVREMWKLGERVPAQRFILVT